METVFPKLPPPVFTRVYLAGPMTGQPEDGYPAFHAAAAALRARGYDVVNPAELNPVRGEPWDTYLRRDLPALVTCEAVAVLPGWMVSRGAQLELIVAHELGLPVVDAVALAAGGTVEVLEDIRYQWVVPDEQVRVQIVGPAESVLERVMGQAPALDSNRLVMTGAALERPSWQAPGGST